MEITRINFVLGASVYYESLLKESHDLGIDTNWWLPLHQNDSPSKDGSYSGEKYRIFDKKLAEKYGATSRGE